MGDSDKKNNVKCYLCECTLSSDHSGIVCGQAHHLCTECSVPYVSSVMDGAPATFPPKCGKCKAEVVLATFERQLDQGQSYTFLSYISMITLGLHERLVSCPKCPYFEVWPAKLSGMDLFFCRNDECQQISCHHCKLACKPEADGYADEDFKISTDTNNFLNHLECAELVEFKTMIDNAIAKGTGAVCPSCGFFGRKDSNCTHITCVKCQTIFCYVCGLSEAVCDKDNPSGNIYSHNIDWATNAQRCPMHLIEISEVDDRWSEEDDECVAFLSRLNTIRLLRETLQSIGPAMFHRLRNKYDAIKNCGFTEDEIMTTDVTIIHR